MEFLLLNHPLDCPVCDAGGECGCEPTCGSIPAFGTRACETMNETRFRQVIGQSPAYWGGAAALALLVLAGLMAAHRMEELGHVITGMDNQVAWGLPHVFAVFLIVAASGSLNVASVASVFGRVEYKPLARLSGLLAIVLFRFTRALWRRVLAWRDRRRRPRLA